MRFSKRLNDQFGIFTPLVNVASIDGSSNGNRLTAANTSVQIRSISSSFWAPGSGVRQRKCLSQIRSDGGVCPMDFARQGRRYSTVRKSICTWDSVFDVKQPMRDVSLEKKVFSWQIAQGLHPFTLSEKVDCKDDHLSIPRGWERFPWLDSTICKRGKVSASKGLLFCGGKDVSSSLLPTLHDS
jgi:hypothetical protein